MIRRRSTALFLEGGSVTGEDAASFIARLRDPIIIDQETEVALNSVVMDFPEDNTIQTGANDQVAFMLSGGSTALTAVIRSGTYTGSELANELQRALNLAGPAAESPGYNKVGSWRADYGSASVAQQQAANSVYYEIKYQNASRAVPPSADVTATGGTYANGNFQAAVQGTLGTCTLKRPLATNIGYAFANVETARDFSWGITADLTAGATPVVQVDYDKVTETFTLTVRGVASTPAQQPSAALAKSLIIATKVGSELVLAYRDATAAAEAPFTEFTRVSLLDSDGPMASGNLFIPQLYVFFATDEAGTTFTSIKSTPDPFDTAITIAVDGVNYEIGDASELAKHNPAVHAQLYGGEPGDGLDAFPPAPGTGGRLVTLDFDVAATVASLLGFGLTEQITRAATTSAPAVWNSTSTPAASIDSSGLQTALYVTSSALNVGSRYSSSAAVSTPFILGSVPAVAQYGKQSHIENTANDPFYQHVAVAGRQALTNIDIQIRDSAMVIVALPSSGPTQSRSRVELRVRNHPVS